MLCNIGFPFESRATPWKGTRRVRWRPENAESLINWKRMSLRQTVKTNPSGNDATTTLAAFSSRLAFEEIPADVIEKAKLCLLDTLGCCIYGSTLPLMKRLIGMLLKEGGKPAAVILGTSHRTSASQAALANGTAAHAFQLDEVHTGATLHPGSVVVPAILALSGLAQLSGRAFLTAMVSGYEVGIRIGLATEGGMFKRGYHNQGTTGTLAAAAAAARAPARP